MKLAIVEDDGITMFFLKESIEELGHEAVGIFDNGNSLISFLKKNEVDLVFMDINIAGKLDGIQAAQKIHIKYPKISFVFMTSYKDTQTITEAQIVKPLGYMVKPITFSDIEAILMVVHGLKNETKEKIESDILCGDYRYNLESKTLFKNEVVVDLSLKEQLCLYTLIKNKNSYTSSKQLIESIWGDETKTENSLRELIYRLRKKIPCFELVTMPNIGYNLKFKKL